VNEKDMFEFLKTAFETMNCTLIVRTYQYKGWRTSAGRREWKWFEGVCVGHRDGQMLKDSQAGEIRWWKYRSKADFIRMMLGMKETSQAAEFRHSWRSPVIRPIAGSVEELEFRLAARGVDLEKHGGGCA